jgi:hypothetical protein
MFRTHKLLLLILLSFFLGSCEFKCNVGEDLSEKDKPPASTGTNIYNNIDLESNVKIRRAYLAFPDGKRVASDNYIDFTQPVKMIVMIDSGWVVQNDSVLLGASERIETESGQILLDEQDLFQAVGFISATDAKIIAVAAKIIREPNSPPSSYKVSFRIWDKNGKGAITGNYTLNSK